MKKDKILVQSHNYMVLLHLTISYHHIIFISWRLSSLKHNYVA